jgi:hypothetical protein
MQAYTKLGALMLLSIIGTKATTTRSAGGSCFLRCRVQEHAVPGTLHAASHVAGAATCGDGGTVYPPRHRASLAGNPPSLVRASVLVSHDAI